MILEGDESVIDAIKEKKRLIDAGEGHVHIRPLLFIDGGLMKGVYAVGAGLTLEELGYGNVFNSVVGVSSGAPLAAYFVAGETKKGSSILWEECTSKQFLNVWRFWNQVDTKYLIKAISNGSSKALRSENVFASRTELHIAVSNFKTGEPRLLKPTDRTELFDAIHASILLPNASSNKVHIEDIRYVDGGFTRPHSLKLAIESIQPTHVLIITNQDKAVSTIPWLERFLNHTLYRHRMPAPLRFAAHERKRERLRVIEEMGRNDLPYALVWGNGSIKSMERDPEVVKGVVEKSRKWWLELFR